jgi:hypothetical protein
VRDTKPHVLSSLSLPIGAGLPTRRPRPAWFPVAALLVIALLTAPLAFSRAVALVEGVLTAPDEASALASARAAGRPVEAIGDRTEFSQTFANPSGTLTMNENVMPVRARRPDGTWAPVDYSLRAMPDGSIAPASSMADVAFSGGGPGPMARIVRNGDQIALGWPGPLPVPRLSGATATYPDVLPGVDLQLIAEPLGFSTLLVVKTPAAARNPALSVVRLPLMTDHVTLMATGAGGLTAVDGVDTEVFNAPSASMWDATGARRASVGVRVHPGELDLLPDPGMLTSPSTQFPVSIDPYVTVSGTQANWTKVNACFPSQTYWNGANDSDPNREGSMKVGMSPSGYGDPCDGMAWRTYFLFNTAAVQGKTIHKVTFNVFETWAASCNAKPVDLYVTGLATSSTDWSSPPSGATLLLEKSFAHGWSTNCGATSELFDVSNQLNPLVPAHNPMTLMLRAPNEGHCFADSTHGDTCQWKRFDSGALLASQKAFLSIEYNTPPNAPTGLYTSGSPFLYPNGQIPCNANTNYVNTATPTMHATISDPDDHDSTKPQPLTATYSWTGSATGSVVSPSSTGQPPPGPDDTLATSASIPSADHLANGSSVDWSVAAGDGVASVPASATCHLTVDTIGQTVFPGITSTDGRYPVGGAQVTTPVGTRGAFTFDPGTATDVRGYLYGLNASTPWKLVNATGPASTADVTIVPPDVGDNSLAVQIIGLGGNLGPIQTYHVIAGHGTTGSVLVYHIGMNEGTGRTMADDVGGHTTTAVGATSWTTGPNGVADHAVHFASLPGGYMQTPDPTVDTRSGFTVSAWVKLDDTASGYRIVSQDGAHGGAGYYLESLAGTAPRWAFSVPQSDGANPVTVHAVSDAAPSVGVWTHLVGVFCNDVSCLLPTDPGSGVALRVYLYVNDVLQSTSAAGNSPWWATGPMQIGRGLSTSGTDPVPHYTNLLNGAVDDVSAYWGDPCPPPTAASTSCTGLA